MKKNRLILSMQTISILPAIFFLFIYARDNLFSLLTMVALCILLGINIYKYIKKLPLINYSLVLLLMGSFYLYTFYGLGNIHAPQTFEKLKDGDNVTHFNFSTPQSINKICYFVGINKNVHFTLESMQNNKWETFYTYDESNFPYSFRWSCIEKNVHTDKILLRITKNSMMLNEVRFMYNDTLIPYTSNSKLLNDEPEPIIDTSYYSSMFFDEIYHGRTAYEILHGLDIYENTHPYLGKLLLMPGIKLFGMTPFGWRVMNVLFAGLLILVAFFFAKDLFKKRLFALTAGVLMTYSFMHYTQARLAHIDTFGVLFILTSYLFLYRFIIKQYLYLLLYSGVFYGLASGVKWSAVFGIFGFILIALYLLISHYPLKKRFSGYRLVWYGFLSYGIVGGIVYLLTFVDIYSHTGSLQSIIDYNINMYHYHSGIKATHAYSSPWWSWMLDLKPMCYYREVKDGLFSSITSFGNPAIFWLGAISMIYLLCVACIRRSLEASFILFAFLGLYLPYIFVGRLMFIYHFYYAMPFMILGIVYFLRDLVKRVTFFKKYYLVYLLVVIALFLAFYPVLSGYGVPQSYVDHYLKWGSKWWF
ncbi:MAG: hypothetical protein DSZ09_00455 [Sulfurovum sp.]|nr:MAG: hypothetical protein DSZ09_00455 [Sulfurovum sp.]